MKDLEFGTAYHQGFAAALNAVRASLADNVGGDEQIMKHIDRLCQEARADERATLKLWESRKLYPWEMDLLAVDLRKAWKVYERAFHEPPHGSQKQLRALLEFLPEQKRPLYV